MHQGFTASATVENQFNGFFEGDAFAFLAAAVVEVMIFFVFQSDIEFFENAAFLA